MSLIIARSSFRLPQAFGLWPPRDFWGQLLHWASSPAAESRIDKWRPWPGRMLAIRGPN